MSTYVSLELARLLMNERLREADQARMARDTREHRGPVKKRSILHLFRRETPAACPC